MSKKHDIAIAQFNKHSITMVHFQIKYGIIIHIKKHKTMVIKNDIGIIMVPVQNSMILPWWVHIKKNMVILWYT